MRGEGGEGRGERGGKGMVIRGAIKFGQFCETSEKSSRLCH